MVKPGFSHFHMEKWHITIATRIPLLCKICMDLKGWGPWGLNQDRAHLMFKKQTLIANYPYLSISQFCKFDIQLTVFLLPLNPYHIWTTLDVLHRVIIIS